MDAGCAVVGAGAGLSDDGPDEVVLGAVGVVMAAAVLCGARTVGGSYQPSKASPQSAHSGSRLRTWGGTTTHGLYQLCAGNWPQ